MANRRMLSKTISTSVKVNKLSTFGALLYTWMIPHCDDNGRMDGEAIAVRAIVCPMRIETVEEVEKQLQTMEDVGLIRRYIVDDQQYLEIIGFSNFQTFKSDRPKEQRFPLDSKRKPLDSKWKRKLSKDKLSKGKIDSVAIATRPPEEGIIKFFESVNPSYERLYSNTTQRGAAKRLLEKYGAEKVGRMVASLHKFMVLPGCPQITTPDQLEKKLGQYIAFIKQQEKTSAKSKFVFL